METPCGRDILFDTESPTDILAAVTADCLGSSGSMRAKLVSLSGAEFCWIIYEEVNDSAGATPRCPAPAIPSIRCGTALMSTDPAGGPTGSVPIAGAAAGLGALAPMLRKSTTAPHPPTGAASAGGAAVAPSRVAARLNY